MLPALHKLQKSRGYDPDSLAWVYTVAMSTLMGTLAGVVQSIMGSPGDLPETIAAIHEKARMQMHSCDQTSAAKLPTQLSPARKSTTWPLLAPFTCTEGAPDEHQDEQQWCTLSSEQRRPSW